MERELETPAHHGVLLDVPRETEYPQSEVERNPQDEKNLNA
jgi:hypothetical protein